MNYDAIALWSQVLAAFAFAAIIVWGYRKFLIPSLQAATVAKNEEIAARERRRDEAKRAAESARAKIGDAENSAGGIRDRAIHEASRRSEHMISEAWRESERTLRGAEHELARTRLIARDQLRVDMLERALQRARAHFREKIDAATDAGLIERFFENFEHGRPS